MLCRMMHFVNIFSSLSPIASPKGAEETLCFNQFSVIKIVVHMFAITVDILEQKRVEWEEDECKILRVCVFVITVVVIVFSELL